MRADRLLVVGGDAAGMSAATAARRLRPAVLQARGLEVTIVLADSLPMSLRDADMGERICEVLRDMGIGVQPDQPVRAVETGADGAARAVTTDGGGSDLPCAPPFSSVYDPVVVAARVAGRVERG